MYKLIHKLIRYSNGHANVAADIHAAIAVGDGGISRATVRSESHIVQRNGRSSSGSSHEESQEKEVNDGKED